MDVPPSVLPSRCIVMGDAAVEPAAEAVVSSRSGRLRRLVQPDRAGDAGPAEATRRLQRRMREPKPQAQPEENLFEGDCNQRGPSERGALASHAC